MSLVPFLVDTAFNYCMKVTMTMRYCKFALIVVTCVHCCCAQQEDNAVPLSFKGLLTINSGEYYNLQDASTNQSFWIQKSGQMYGIKVISYDHERKTLHFIRNTTEYMLQIETPSNNSALFVYSARTKHDLSEDNIILLKHHKSIIKATRTSSGAITHDKVNVENLARFLKSNPSQAEFADYIAQNAPMIDFHALAGLELPPRPPKRDRFNTPGLGLNDKNDTND